MSRGLPRNVKNCLDKAINSALLAVEAYNKPAIKFKSGGYIVLMNIAWTSLFHAIFFVKKTNPYYKIKNSKRYKKVDGELQFWELSTCVKNYFGEEISPIRKNLEFFIPLRNKIEHKFMPEIDSNIFAECQASLLNFDKMVEKEFGENYCIRESLSFALQLFPSNATLHMSVNGNKDSQKVINFINQYRSSITTEVLQSGEYSFKAFLIQVANHNSLDALPIQFYPYDKLSEDDKRKVERLAGLIKEKHIKVPISNKDCLKPGAIVKLVQDALGDPKVQRNKKQIDKFNMTTHTRACQKYDVKPQKGAENPEQTNTRYCLYDEVNDNYVYTKAWADFLIEKLADENEWSGL